MSAIAERSRCRVSKIWQKYKCETRASNLLYPTIWRWRRRITILLCYVTVFVLNAKLFSI